VPPEVDHLTFLCEFTEGTPNRDNLRIGDDGLPRVIGLNIEGERRKLDRVNQPVLTLQ